MRVAVGGFMHESNTFAPLPADRERFLEGSLTYGPAMVPVWQSAHHEVGGFVAGTWWMTSSRAQDTPAA